MTSAHSRFSLSMIALAGWLQFAKDQRLSLRNLEACSLNWCKAGGGTMRINGRLFPMEPNSYVLAPWRHHVEYHASAVSPFFVAAVHFIPCQRRRFPVQFDVAHDKYRITQGATERRGISWPEFMEPYAGTFAQQPALGFLAEYILARFTREEPKEEPMRELGRMLGLEVHHVICGTETRPVPPELQRLELFIRHHLYLRLDLDELVAFSRLSGSTIQRLFLKYHGISPRQWILREKTAMAKTLLRSSHAALPEIAEKIGINDPYYFCRFFRRQTGETPARYRRRSSAF